MKGLFVNEHGHQIDRFQSVINLANLYLENGSIINIQSINQSNFYSTNIPGDSQAQWRDIQIQCSTAKSMKQFHNANSSSGILVSMGKGQVKKIFLVTFPEGGN